MPGSTAREPSAGRWIAIGITALLVIAAIVRVGFHATLALGPEDVDPYESPLMLSVGRQLIAGPWELYGPYGGSNPLVLIHAPLYYRAAALLAWPMARVGLHPVVAARVAGRSLSVLGLAAAMAAAYRLGRLGGLPRRTGWWSALLLAASPLLGGQPFAVRPDMVGVALQSWGVVLVLESSVGARNRLEGASALFGLAVCVKQHMVMGWAVSAGLAIGLRRRLGPGAVSRLVLPGAAVAAAVYGAEWLATDGRVWEAAFVAAAHVGRVHPGDWLHVGTVVAAMAGKEAGLAAMVLAGAAAKRSRGSAWSLVAATLVIGTIALLSAAQLVSSAAWITLMLPTVALVGLLVGALGCAAGRSSPADGRIDAMLGLYAVGEVLLLVLLCRSSSGAWINYGIPAMLLVAVLAARSLAGALESAPGLARAISTVAAAAVLASVLMEAKVEASRRRVEHGDLERIIASTGLPPLAFFFADRPGLNRMSGRLEWVFDDWLYPVFESRKLAEPRARWLRATLGPSGGARAVVMESDRPGVDGIPAPLPELGFRTAVRVGRFHVWIRGLPSSGAL